MENRPGVPLFFRGIRPRCHTQGLTWREPVIQYHHQCCEHASATPPAKSSSEIPLGESALTFKLAIPPGAPNTHLTHPPINAAGENYILSACKPDDPIAKERVRENTKLLVDSGIAETLCIDRALDASLFEKTEASNASYDNAEIKRQRAHEAHSRFWDAIIGGADKVLGRCPDES
ncbi:uncharacterized protein N7479_011412 [Penicillium vulpinum]|uniref:Uncharacterized protein n=1 Tax=Penicillium vulpinum TaxID=29845 RepID=A0A1V6RXE5_9EURO|nr:uncharacterized protein N7479_011412 [Penicillium vulpinum]KAJ5952999.1 hypothetical protein N7479_011412 [Penicillium vulpinum]OQE06441.1 hypothetical protein PENVUL_c018G07642 [Penicillium vulpinum]